ncbi:transmembrane protein, putative [Bodo saltans]|uniref:Transmembrane protein, putative n=1 Tax=Bodo saltans TaxID=75058 RepID=A0A0S4ISB1_BODSA|nr:transmembrane protein, putative [Bodo saltans]|eukprot:CUE97792.1 transmembrane protein, putative [Bodo saltans]
MASWIDDIVRCPAQLLNLTRNGTNSSSLLLDSSLVLPNGEDTLDLHNLSTLVRALLTVGHDQHHHEGRGDGAASHSTAKDLFPFASTTLLYGLLSLESLVFCVWCGWRLRGLLVFAASRRSGDIVRCPAQFLNLTWNATNSSSLLLDSSLVLPNGEDTLDLHNLSTLVRALLTVGHDQHHHEGRGDGAASHSTAKDLFPFASTTLLYGLLSLESLVFCVWCGWRLRGLLVFAASRRSGGGGSRSPSHFFFFCVWCGWRLRGLLVFAASRRSGSRSPSHLDGKSVVNTNSTTTTPLRGGSRYGSIFQPDGATPKNSTFTKIFGGWNRSRSDSVATPLVVNRSGGHAEESPVQVRIVTKSTDNTVWAFYFGSVVVLRLIATGTLVFAANYSGDNHEEALRISLLVQRVVHGVSCVWLAVALNIQRLYRVKDHKNAKANQALLRQATFINRFCFATFLIFSVGDFITSHTVSATSAAADALFWVSVGSLLLLAIPTILSTFWVVLHESQMQPTRLAKCMLTLGVLMHTIVELPPAFWNDHLLESFVDRTPCPLTYLSFYDMILVGQCITAGLLFAFVLLEHRRTSTIVHLDYLAFCDDRLYRRMQPTRLAKCMLTFGVLMHTIVELPPAFWNDHLLESFVDRTPCPLTYLSFYDMILVGQCITAGLLFAFVLLEHRRTSTIVHLDYLAFCDDRLYRRLTKDGTLPKQPLLLNVNSTTADKPPLGPGGRRSGGKRRSGGAAVKFRQHSMTSTAHSMSTVNTPKHPREGGGDEDDGFVQSERLDDAMFDDDDNGLNPQYQEEGYDDGAGEFTSEPTMMESDFARMEDGAVDEDVGRIRMF